MHIAKWLVVIVAVWNFGGYVVDAVIPITAKQHLYNPRWPPHAKFHNCQTMVIGIFLGLITLWIRFGMGPLTFPLLCLAAAISGSYFISMLFAPTFPGTAWHDPEFIHLDPMSLRLPSQKLVTFIVGACILACTSN